MRKETQEEIISKFWSSVKRSSKCWKWTGFLDKGGYGRLYVSSRLTLAHRFSLKIAGKEFDSTMWVDHKCRNRKCVKPSHLRIVTPRENALENNASGPASNAKRKKCIKGHPLSGENLYSYAGRRQCAKCTNERNRKAYKARKAIEECAEILK